MYVFTFYSFKGGVGRTMALANVAAELVRRGRKVLVVDFDLEAPGLETYKHLRPEQPQPGIVEYVAEFRRTHEVPDVREYIYETKPIGKKGGRLWVMPAGRRDAAYRSALANLDWQRLYKDEHGFLLFEDTKQGWKQEYQPDYVLIDSRTGDTDVLGICTRQLPDSVVLMFVPNEQNLAGLENVCRDIRREQTEGLKKTIKLHFVAANVPDLDDAGGILRRQLQAFRERLEYPKLSGIIRRYENLNLLDQSIFTLDRPHTRLARSLRRLLSTLLRDNLSDRDGSLLFLKDYPDWIEQRISDAKFLIENYDGFGDKMAVSAGHGDVSAEGKRSLHEIGRNFPNDVEILMKVSDCFIKEEQRTSAVAVLDRILELNPNSADALFQRALCNVKLGKGEEAAENFFKCLHAVDLNAELSLHGAWHMIGDCVTILTLIAPHRLSAVVDLVESQVTDVQNISSIANIANWLSSTEEGVPHAAQLLRRYLIRLNEADIEGKVDINFLANALLRARCWKEAIKILENKILEQQKQKPHQLLQLALAHWGEHGEMPESICREALECDFGGFASSGIQSLEVASWLLWRTGNIPDALAALKEAEKWAFRETDEIYSLWRLRDVALQEYLNDCQFVRRMIQGESVRPAFLGPAAS